MHEIGLLRQLVRTVTAFAAENGVSEIREVVVDCGELSLVIPEYLEELYPVLVNHMDPAGKRPQRHPFNLFRLNANFEHTNQESG